MRKFVGSIKCICWHFFACLEMHNKNLKILSRREKIFDLKNIINRSKNYEGLVDYGQVRNFRVKLMTKWDITRLISGFHQNQSKWLHRCW